MTEQLNFTTVEPMTEAEVMYAEDMYIEMCQNRITEMGGGDVSYHPQYDNPHSRWEVGSVSFKKRDIRELFDPESKTFYPMEFPWCPEDEGLDSRQKEAEQERFDQWCYEAAIELWKDYLHDAVSRSLSELKELSGAVMDEKGRYAQAWSWYTEISHGYHYGEEVEFIHDLKDLLDDMQKWINELKAKARIEIKTLEGGAVFLVSRSFLAAPRSSSRSRRSPIRSAAKKGGDDGGGDGDSDQGEPPRPSHKGRIILPAPIQARQFLLTHKPNSLSLSRTPHPCYWCMERRWAA
jgi:hypothetical protein